MQLNRETNKTDGKIKKLSFVVKRDKIVEKDSIMLAVTASSQETVSEQLVIEVDRGCGKNKELNVDAVIGRLVIP